MSTIIVLGANGQVGLEVCLFLGSMAGIAVVPVVRSQLGATLLERCGLDCRVGTLSSSRDGGRLLEGADLVVDFRLPSGLPAEIRRATREGMGQCMRLLPRQCPYVYISSTMAFGMDTDKAANPKYRWHSIARTPYATYKRYAERCTRWYGLATRRETYILRLGQVFGELQGVSRGWLQSVRQGPIAMPDAGRGLSDAVFCGTIALALSQIALRRERPGTYTLVESPDWRWSDVYDFHAVQAGILRKLESIQAVSRTASLTAPLRALAKGLLSRKDLLVAHLMPPTVAAQQFIKARNLTRLAATDIALGRAPGPTPMVGYLGRVPGARLRSLHDSWTVTQAQSIDVRRLLDERLGSRSHNYHGATWSPGHDRRPAPIGPSAGWAQT